MMIKDIWNFLSTNKIASTLSVALIIWGCNLQITRWNLLTDTAAELEKLKTSLDARAKLVTAQIKNAVGSEIDTIISDGLTDYEDAWDDMTDWRNECWNELNKARVRDGLEPIAQP